MPLEPAFLNLSKLKSLKKNAFVFMCRRLLGGEGKLEICNATGAKGSIPDAKKD
jgi:hypothetical protein